MNVETETKKELQTARLEDWYIDGYDCLVGKAYGHPHFPDGEIVRTSRVVKLDKKRNLAVTRNTEYVLGSPQAQLNKDGGE